jgi:dTDP-4-dehydrorhamnose reductase
MKCLILGATGQVGGQLAARCEARSLAYLGTAHRRSHPEYSPLDIRDQHAVNELVAGFRPDVTFLPAAFTHVDYAETHAGECHAVNLAGTANVARAVRQHGGTLAFFSTDHVFGECEFAMREEDPVAPLSVYAKTKVEAEAAIRDALPDRHLILRTSWVYGPDDQGKNFVVRTVRQFAEGKRLTVASDQYGQPTYGPDLAETALDLALGGYAGTFHVVGPERVTRFAFARLVCHVFGFDCDLVKGVPTPELGQDAPRPGRVWLDRYKLRSALGPKAIRTPGEGLRDLRSRLGWNAPSAARAA